MRLAFVALALLSLVACVDGKTPDCSTVDSGCLPGDGSSGGGDASDAGDSATTDATATDGSLLDVSLDVTTD